MSVGKNDESGVTNLLYICIVCPERLSRSKGLSTIILFQDSPCCHQDVCVRYNIGSKYNLPRQVGATGHESGQEKRNWKVTYQCEVGQGL